MSNKTEVYILDTPEAREIMRSAHVPDRIIAKLAGTFRHSVFKYLDGHQIIMDNAEGGYEYNWFVPSKAVINDPFRLAALKAAMKHKRQEGEEKPHE
jgi:hypothetical protein